MAAQSKDAAVRAFVSRVDEVGRVRQAVPFVGQHEQVWELGLRLFGVLQAFQGYDDHARLPFGEVLVAPFELDQLLDAERSPPAAESGMLVHVVTTTSAPSGRAPLALVLLILMIALLIGRMVSSLRCASTEEEEPGAGIGFMAVTVLGSDPEEKRAEKPLSSEADRDWAAVEDDAYGEIERALQDRELKGY